MSSPVSALMTRMCRSWTRSRTRVPAWGRLDDSEIRAGYEEARRAIELGAMVPQSRLDAGLSQEELAQRTGMTQPYVRSAYLDCHGLSGGIVLVGRGYAGGAAVRLCA